MPIKLTSDITATRGINKPTQDTQLESNEKVYVWANTEATSGTADWTQNAYIQAWEMTADGSGNLSSSNTYYYPPTSLSMVAIHGNFSFMEGTDAFPGVVTHTVKTDQSAKSDYTVSDLLYWKENGLTGNNNPINIAFNHKLSKIEIHLVKGDYTEDELDKMTVTLCNVLPTVEMNVTDGTISQAHGTAVRITPLKTGKVDYEAIIPPQQKPLDFIEVRYNGTIVKVDAQVNGFDSNQRYKYDFGLSNKDIRKNPLWYVAEYNVNYSGGTYSWATTLNEGYLFSWNDALTAANKFDGWHLPTKYEYNSIFPGTDTSTTPTTYDMSDAARVNIFEEIATSDGSAAEYTKTARLSFGYNETSNNLTEKSYWYRVNTSLVYAIRYLDSDFCSAWKYEWAGNGLTTADPATVTITSVLLGTKLSKTDAQDLFGTDETKWEALFADLQFVNGNDIAHGAAQRVFASKGYNGDGSSANPKETTGPGNNGQYWSSTSHNSHDAYLFCFWRNTSTSFLLACHEFGTKTYARPIRLFRDRQVDVKRNALWYVSTGNMSNATTMGTSENTTLFTWTNAMSNFSTSSASKTAYYKGNKTITGQDGTWHLPVRGEWLSIIPVEGTYYDPTYANILELDGYRNYATQDIIFGYNTETKGGISESSYWKKVSGNMYAIRFLGTDYCSAWKYEFTGSGTSSSPKRMRISAQLIQIVEDCDEAASAWYTANWSSLTFDDDTSVTRDFYSSGYQSTGDRNHLYTSGYFWSATENSSDNAKACCACYGTGARVDLSTTSKTTQFSIRLFRDN